MDKKIKDFNEALHESIIKNFSSVENAQIYADKLSKFCLLIHISYDIIVFKGR